MAQTRFILPNFFVLEGLDGSGKSTLIRHLKERLPQARFDQEPTYSLIGKQIRELIKETHHPLQTHTLLLLFSADRFEHCFGDKGISFKEDAQILLCDRYFFSTLAYQGSDARALSFAQELNQPFPLPEILFYLDIPVEESLKRINERGETRQLDENLERLKELKKNYEKILTLFQKKKICV